MANLIPLAIADVELQLATSVAAGGTSFTLSSATDDDGNALPAGMYCFTVDSGTSSKEYLLGQLNGVSVTGVSRVSRQGVSTSGAAKAHRVGAPVILTNFATLQRVADILRGQIALDGANPINYDAEPTLTDRVELATVGYVLDTATGGTVAFDKQIITGVNAGETVASGDFLYLKTSDQEWYKADASVVATSENVQIGIAQGSGTDGAAISGGVLISGVHTTTGLTAGSPYYISDTSGAIAATAGTIKVVVGIALSTTKLLITQKTPETVTSQEKVFLGSIAGIILPYGGTSAPSGFLLCDGAAVSRTTYSTLFGIISTGYGVGDGSTTFNVPDLKGRVPTGRDAAQTEFDVLGETGGAKTHTLTETEIPSHTHTYRGTNTGATSGTKLANSTGGTDSTTTDATGGGSAHNNLQPYQVVNYIIKT